MRKGRKIVASTVLIATVCILSACGSNEPPITIARTVSDIETVANVRYTGYNEEVEEALNKSFSPELAQQLKEEIQSKEDSLIDITDVVMKSTHEDIERKLDDSIIRKDNKYYIDTGKVEFNYPDIEEKVIQVYDSDYKLKKSEISVNMNELKGNENYKLAVTSYDLYDDNTLEVTLSSSVKGNIMTNKQVIEVEVNEDGEITQADTTDFNTNLMYD